MARRETIIADNAGRPHKSAREAVRADLETVLSEPIALAVLEHREVIEAAYADLDALESATVVPLRKGRERG